MSRDVPESEAAAQVGRDDKMRQMVAAGQNSRASSSRGTTFLTVVLVFAVLYFARTVFMPLALAVLFSFLLAPLVIRLRHWGLGRVPAVLIVVLFAFLATAIMATLVASQTSDLARKLPEYQQNIRQKMQSIRASGGGLINRATRFIHNFTEDVGPKATVPPESGHVQPGEEKPVPVEIRKAPFAPLEMLQTVLGSVLNIVLMAGIVIVFSIFMLMQREDLRDRVIRLMGAGRVNVTTQALDDAAGRLGRYLLAQLVINVVFGVVAGVGLYFLGVPNPALWGMLAAVMRYVPYLGIWIAAIMPAVVAFAVEPGWIKLPIVFGMYFGIDLLMYNFAEPLLYGTSTGVSALAILVAAVFWAWLWGPVGLLLATPLTVCVVVIGRYVPSLEFLSILLSDEPVLRPETRFYQRLLAMDLEEATEVAEEFLKGKSLEEFYDEVVIPALSLAEQDRHCGKLDETRQKFIFQGVRFIVEDMAERAEELVAGNGSSRGRTNGKPRAQQPKESVPETQPCVLCIPARDEADEIAALMLCQLLNKRSIAASVISAAALASECVDEVSRRQTRVACVEAVPPFGYTHARYLCRRLRVQFPDLKLIAAILTEREPDELKSRKPAIAADELASSLRRTLAGVISLVAGGEHQLPAPALSST